MTGHFVTACGCECYLPVKHLLVNYRLPVTRHIPWDQRRPFTTPCDSYEFRMFKLESVHGDLAEYREVLQ